MSEGRADHDEKPPLAERVVRFHYIKSNLFRTFQADGAVGGIGPRGDIQLSFWSERAPIPRSVSHPIISEEGHSEATQVGPELQERRDIRDGFVREVETMVRMNAETARALIAFLERTLRDRDRLVNELKSGEE